MKFKILSFLTVIVFVLNFIAIGIAGAQNQIESELLSNSEIIESALNANLQVLPIQEYPSKKIGIELTINSLIDSDRVGVKWSYPINYFFIDGSLEDIVSVRKNQTTTFIKYFIPKEGIKTVVDTINLEFTASLSSFEADVYYFNTVKTTANFNNELELLPISSNYSQSKLVSTIVYWAIRIFIVAVIIFGIVFAVNKFIKYIKSPDPET